jgi:hypothetical protein
MAKLVVNVVPSFDRPREIEALLPLLWLIPAKSEHQVAIAAGDRW